jgi:glycosyltransferase involved in cell wall biosynthesis
MMESMAVHFSKRIDYRILVPSYLYSKSQATSMSGRIRIQLFGEESIRRAVLDFQPELVYSDSALHAAVLKLFSLSVRKSIPFVIHLRGNWWQEYYSWFTNASWRRRAFSSQQYCYNWFSLITSKSITPICKWLEKVVRCHLPFKPTRVVYQGVDPLEFDETSETYEFVRPAVAIIQNHTILPKVAGLLRFSAVIKNLPSVHFYITEGEAYDQRYVGAVKQAMEGLRNAHFVKGINSPNAVRQMLNSVDCYVLATELDCCPTTVLEASLMRKPVIASRVGGVPETIWEGKTGWTIPNDHVYEWVRRINQIAHDEELGTELGMVGRKWVAANFAWTKIASQVEDIILKTVQE